MLVATATFPSDETIYAVKTVAIKNTNDITKKNILKNGSFISCDINNKKQEIPNIIIKTPIWNIGIPSGVGLPVVVTS